MRQRVLLLCWDLSLLCLCVCVCVQGFQCARSRSIPLCVCVYFCFVLFFLYLCVSMDKHRLCRWFCTRLLMDESVLRMLASSYALCCFQNARSEWFEWIRERKQREREREREREMSFLCCSFQFLYYSNNFSSATAATKPSTHFAQVLLSQKYPEVCFVVVVVVVVVVGVVVVLLLLLLLLLVFLCPSPTLSPVTHRSLHLWCVPLLSTQGIIMLRQFSLFLNGVCNSIFFPPFLIFFLQSHGKADGDEQAESKNRKRKVRSSFLKKKLVRYSSIIFMHLLKSRAPLPPPFRRTSINTWVFNLLSFISRYAWLTHTHTHTHSYTHIHTYIQTHTRTHTYTHTHTHTYTHTHTFCSQSHRARHRQQSHDRLSRLPLARV